MTEQNIHPVLVAFVEEVSGNIMADYMDEICRHLKLEATLEDFSDFVYSKEKLCREELKMDRNNTDALFSAVTGVNVAVRWGKTFDLEWMGFVVAHCLPPTMLPP
jgi:hypothetical protein